MLTDWEILGVSADASKDEIKKAYRHIAHKFHPDKNKDPKASEMFSIATKAYDNLLILKDNISKSQKTSKIHRRGKDIRVSITVPIEDIIKCSKKNIITNRKGPCLKCNGTGSKEKKTKICPYCNGKGLQGIHLVMGQKKPCLFCNGAGIIPQGEKCKDCSGTGLIIEKIHKVITLNPFSDIIQIHGLGNHCINGLPGNLIIEVYTKKHPFYDIHGLDIIGSLSISPARSIIGGTVSIDVFDKKEAIYILPGTQNGSRIEKPNAGIKFENRQGWLKLTVIILIPTIITAKEKEYYERILKIEGESACLKALSL